MPLGVQQNNDFTQFTMDVWNDKIFYQEKEFPAGFMAMSILNIPEEKLPELIPVSYTHLDVYKRQPSVSASSV